ncbi:MAG TPA: prepilin-type N-terminal cleavage/methylation domain-containing protein [Terriglobales bacterium]|jgi:prepilin-type N-terminal cleavage/methylation domain-containing protein|nr:prepilin-type N-terminal cleavage/methylation domain-containing protein [Terriglobales bacterium]
MKLSAKKFGTRSSKSRGFSLIEMLMVVSIAIVASGMAFMSLIPAIKDARVGSSVNSALATMRRAREEAVSKRRVYVVKFITPGTIQVTQNTTTGTSLITTLLPDDITFVADSSLPSTGPDNFGAGKVAIDFDQAVSGGVPTEIYFQPDGSAVDVHNNVNNGVVYFGRAGELMSSRAVSLWGATGRLRAWRIDTNSQGNLYWRQQ